jgi:glycopeptide antibiotics resistance protein
LIKWFEKHNRISWVLTILIAIGIFYISSLIFKPGAGGLSINSFFYHFFIFFLFCFFLSISMIKGNHKNIKLIFLVLAIAIIYGVTDEIHQYFVPSRCCSFEDVMTNSLGILTAGTIYTIRMRVNHRITNIK